MMVCRTTTLSPCSVRWCASDEITIIKEFLPIQLDEGEISEAVKDAIIRLDANGLKDMGPIMAELRGRFAGRMDFGRASQLVKEQLS